tara:strand:+ start:766 stop:903 length:138 start_codon:yes stop_codon:yes gene_type:complete
MMRMLPSTGFLGALAEWSGWMTESAPTISVPISTNRMPSRWYGRR